MNYIQTSPATATVLKYLSLSPLQAEKTVGVGLEGRLRRDLTLLLLSYAENPKNEQTNKQTTKATAL